MGAMGGLSCGGGTSLALRKMMWADVCICVG